MFDLPAGPSAFGGPLEVLELLTPVMSVTTLLLSLVSERLWHTLPNSPYFSSFEHCLITLFIILAGAVLAFLMVWTEYQVGGCVDTWGAADAWEAADETHLGRDGHGCIDEECRSAGEE